MDNRERPYGLQGEDESDNEKSEEINVQVKEKKKGFIGKLFVKKS